MFACLLACWWPVSLLACCIISLVVFVCFCRKKNRNPNLTSTLARANSHRHACASKLGRSTLARAPARAHSHEQTCAIQTHTRRDTCNGGLAPARSHDCACTSTLARELARARSRESACTNACINTRALVQRRRVTF